MSYPQLFEDGTRNDWHSANYSSKILFSLHSGKAEAHNNLGDSNQLTALIESGLATWKLEIRCPRTLYSKIFYSQDSTIEVSWPPEDTLEPLFFFSGLYAKQDLTIASQELTSIWQDVADIKIPQGWQLIRSKTWGSHTEMSSILNFHRKEENEPGTMKIIENISSGSLEFIVELATDVYDNMKHDRTLQIAALIGALSKLKDKSWDEPDPTYALIKDYFEQNEIPRWDEPEFDSAEVATYFEHFIPNISYLAEEDE